MITECHTDNQLAPETRWSWIDVRRRIEEVSDEKRKTPRIEFHCPVLIEGFQGEKRITDLSLGGVFVECEDATKRTLQTGQALRLLMRLPTQAEPITVKVQVANVRERGIGCKFVELSRNNEEAIEHCFNVFKHTLPIAS